VIPRPTTNNISPSFFIFKKFDGGYCTVGWADIGTRTKVPLRFVTYLSKVLKIDEVF
jgi:hypothetical protein